MTRRERLRRCYFHEELDRPGVYTRSGFPSDDPTYDRLKAYLAERSELKRTWYASQFEAPYATEYRSEPHSEDFERRIEILHTPAGDLCRSWLESLKGQPGLHETYLINSREDAEKYLSLPMPQIVDGDFESFHAADRAVGDGGIVDVEIGSNPGGFVAELCGSVNFAMLSVTDREVIHALCARQMEIVLARVKFVIARGVGPYFSMLGEEYIVPPLHGPDDFRDFNVKYDAPIAAVVHESGGRLHCHCHGSIRKVFDGFLQIGIDVLHPFEPPPQGDIAPREAKERARGEMCLEGNIQISRMYEASPDEIERETRALVEAAFDDRRGLIVAPTASPYIRGRGEECFPQYRAMVETVLESGR